MSSITYMSWKVFILALKVIVMDKKSVTYPKEEKIQLPLGVRGAKAAALFSIFGTDKQILFAKQVFEFQEHCVIEF